MNKLFEPFGSESFDPELKTEGLMAELPEGREYRGLLVLGSLFDPRIHKASCKIERITNRAERTKVNLKTIFSSPRLVNDDELPKPLEKPVPLD